MRNLLFYGATDYGLTLSNSDEQKFKELSEGFNIFVFSNNKNPGEVNFEYTTIKYIKKFNSLILNYIYFYFINIFNFLFFVRKHNIEIVSARDPISALIPVILKKLSIVNFHIVIEHHGNYLDLLLNQRNFYFKNFIIKISNIFSNFSYRNCDFIRGVHYEQTQELGNLYNKNNLSFPAWVDNTTFCKPELKIKNNKLLFVGNIIPRKGVLFLIKSFSEFSKLNQYKYEFLVVGNSPNKIYMEECQKFINTNDIHNISLLGQKSPGEVSNIMKQSRLLLMASSFEGLPRVLIESGLCQLPSISSEIDGVSTPFGSVGGTLLYETDNQQQLITKLSDFFNNEELENELIKKCYELSSNLSGNGKFLNNWKKIEKSLYEK